VDGQPHALACFTLENKRLVGHHGLSGEDEMSCPYRGPIADPKLIIL
jgi:hypothetical protein